jgi:GNAT acetyltransferase-like protein
MSSPFSCGRYRFALLDRPGPARMLREWRLHASGFPLPMTDYGEWSESLGHTTWFLGIENEAGLCRGGLAIRVHPSRALPGFRILRVERLGANVDPSAYDATFEALARIARTSGRILRLHVETFSADAGTLARMGDAARAAGLLPSAAPRCYGPTSLIDLAREVPAILAGFNATARQNIRAVGKFPVAIRPVTDPALIPRMDELLRDTMQRTGGHTPPREWQGILPYSAAHPDRSRVIGLFRTDRPEPESLMAYAWGCCHGDHVQYSTAASTRAADLRLPMAYGLAWDLMQWGHAQGAKLFDFGGITEGTQGGADPLGGISDFKRYFKGSYAVVGAEWELEPRPAAARLARFLRGLKSKRRPD